MDKRGKLYVPLICGIMVIMLIATYFQLKVFYDKNNDLNVAQDIGTKQAAIMDAVRQGQRMQLYIDSIAPAVRLEAVTAITCGEPYLNRNIIGRGDCQAQGATQYPILQTALSLYPESVLSSLSWIPVVAKDGSGTVSLQATKRIPIGAFEEPTGTFSGTFKQWPTDYPQVISLFGPRSGAGLRPGIDSTNHPGLDISTNSQTGQKIYSLTEGDARYTEDGEDSYVTVTNDQLIVQYLHVEPATTITGAVIVPQGSTVHVKPGDIIAMTRPHANSPHLHLQIQVPGITKTQVEALWPDKVGDRFAVLDKSYAVTTSNENRVLLNPICFFDRAFITDILKKSGRLSDDTFSVCDEYASKLGLDVKLAPPVSSATPPSAATSTQAAPAADTTATTSSPDLSTRTDASAKVLRTKQNLAQQQLYPYMLQAAQQQGISPELMAAIITQETEGRADAVSPTGCAGIAQFCLSTAKGFSDIFTQLTSCDCSGDSCQQRACTSANDDRFDAHKSIQAQAKLIKQNLDVFKGYDQQLALAIGAYNDGAAVMRRAVAASGKAEHASWPDLKAALQTMPVSNFYPATEGKRKELIDYVDNVLQWYGQWGGQTFAGTIYTGTQYGYYDLHLAINNIHPSLFNTIIAQLQQKVQQCQDRSCIDQAVSSENGNGVTITAEPLDGTTGCLDASERALAYIANQVEWCKSSPSNSCSCPLSNNRDAVYRISASSLQLERLAGQLVHTITMDGLSAEQLGESDQSSEVRYVPSDGTDAATGSQAFIYQKRMQFTSSGSSTPSTISAPGIFNSHYDFESLQKNASGLSFEEKSGDYCVLPPPPKAYCIQDTGGRNMVFYIDLQAHSKPQATITLAKTVRSASKVAINFTSDNPYPYVHIVGKNSTGAYDYYLRVLPLEQLRNYVQKQQGASSPATDVTPLNQMQPQASDVTSLLTASNPPRLVLADGTYATVLAAYDNYAISFLDENLRETAPVITQ